MNEVHELILMLVKSLVSHPELVTLSSRAEVSDKGEAEEINVKVHDDDIGVCIGVKGANAEAIRKLFSQIGFKKTGKHVFVRIDAPRLSNKNFNNEEVKPTQ